MQDQTRIEIFYPILQIFPQIKSPHPNAKKCAIKKKLTWTFFYFFTFHPPNKGKLFSNRTNNTSIYEH